MVLGVVGFAVVVLVALALSHSAQPVPASGTQSAPPRALAPAVVVIPTHRQASVLMTAAGVGLGSWLAFFLSNVSVPDATDAASSHRAWHHLFVTLVYGLVVLLPALVVITICMLQRRRATRGLPREPRWQRFWRRNPVYVEAYRALGRSTALLLLGSGVVAAWMAWLVARHYGA